MLLGLGLIFAFVLQAESMPQVLFVLDLFINYIKTEMRILKTLLFGLVLFMSNFADAQVTSVNYWLKYDTVYCRYDAYFIVNAGSATSIDDRIQFNSQYTIVVPTGNTLTLVKSYAPYEGNEVSGTSTDTVQWSVSTTVYNPIVNGNPTGSDYYGITVPLSPTARYNNLSPGDTVKLFSIALDNYDNCSEGIRIWDNDTDPSSTDLPGDNDFDNGFTIGSASQLYNDNSEQGFPPKPVIVDASVACSDGIEIDLTATTSACQAPLTYSWTGPNGFTATTEDLNLPNGEDGDYKVVVTDAFGCMDSLTITATSKPYAGPDKVMCAGTSDTLVGTPSTGTWSADVVNNPFGATLTNVSPGKTLVTFSDFTLAGDFTFFYSIPGCKDTMTITVNPKPIVSSLFGNELCIDATGQLYPFSSGWVSSDPNVATVSNTGLVTAVAQGTVYFTFTDANGCTNEVGPITVNPPPSVANLGSNSICVGDSTNLSPSFGGTWVSTDPTIFTVDNTGKVIGISNGTASAIYTSAATGCVSDSIHISVIDKPVVSIPDDTLCVYETLQLLTVPPGLTGSWSSSNSALVSVDNNGLATGLQPGFVTVQFTNLGSLCTSDPSDTLWVIPAPTVNNPASNLCIGDQVQLTPNTGGTWATNDGNVATVSPTGLVTAVGSGPVTFTFTDAASGCDATTATMIVDPKPTVSAGRDTICIGDNTVLLPPGGGTWTNLTPSIASLTGTTVVGLASGTAKFLFEDAVTGCFSDTLKVVVDEAPDVSGNNPGLLCVGETYQLQPSTGGTWQAINPSIASVSNSGLVTGLAPGSTTFIFTSLSSGCQSLQTAPAIILPTPVVNIVGPTDMCIGDNGTTATATGGPGQFYSSDPNIATVDPNTGQVTAIAPGVVTIHYVSAINGCTSLDSDPITVHDYPDINFQGPNSICIGTTTTVTSPNGAGTWSSSDPSIVTVTNQGVVTAISDGTAQLTFTLTSTGCPAENPLTVTVSPSPTVTIATTELCIGATTTLTPNAGGTWTSSDESIATVQNDGTVTAIGQGTVTFTFTSDAGCGSNDTDPLVVNNGPVITLPNPNMCIGDMQTISTTNPGTWVSNDPTVATITDAGVITAIAEGTVTFVFTDGVTGCVSDESAVLTVDPPIVTNLVGQDSICVGTSTQFFPSTGGTWQSSDDAIATIDNQGQVTAVSPGRVSFIFTSSTGSNCPSAPTDSITVTPGPSVTLGAAELCIGETMQMTTDGGPGTWESSDPTVATIDPVTGVVTAVSQGQATFTFTESGLGCKSEDSAPVVVHPVPTVLINGVDDICIGGTTQLSPSSGGTWTSSDDNIAIVDATGLVTGVSEGKVVFTFTDGTTGCVSMPTDSVAVHGGVDPRITGNTEICIGTMTTLEPSSGGTWTSSDDRIAVVNANGIVIAKAPGVVNFTFVETATGCTSEGTTGDLVVTSCVDPDFNVTYVDVPVNGDVSTNDGVNQDSTTYGTNPVNTGNPPGSSHTLAMNPDGTYIFQGNTVGVYTFEVPVCVSPMTTACPTTTLTINVLDYADPNNRPVANVDIGSTPVNTPITLNTLVNDHCVVTPGCSLDPASVTIIDGPDNGSVAIDGVTGNTTYTPNNNYLGTDTLTYQVCVQGEPANCATAHQIIIIEDPSAHNSTVAADDFNVTQEGETLTVPAAEGVASNDNDPESDNQTVTPVTYSVAAGDISISADGSYVFVPAPGFYGSVDFIYTICDDNVNQACAEATLHILVIRDLTIFVRVYLEGAFVDGGASVGTTHNRPLMHDGLRDSPFPGVGRVIPDKDPYKFNAYRPFLESSTVSFTHKGVGTQSRFDSIPDPATVFGVTGEDAIVDWVFIELRDKNDYGNIIATRSGLVQRDGDVADLNGEFGLHFPGLAVDDYYVVVRHRNHLGAMTAAAQTPTQLFTLVDFTDPNTGFYVHDNTVNPPYDYTGLAQQSYFPSEPLLQGYLALWAGNLQKTTVNKGGVNFQYVKFTNPDDDFLAIQTEVIGYPLSGGGFNYFSNFDFAFGYQAGDFNMNSKTKQDNPDDDTNLLYGQLIFYPLNTGFIDNFDHFIEQIPPGN